MREFCEELSIDVLSLAGATIADVLECGTDPVPYTLFVLDVQTQFDNARLPWENDAPYWWHVDAVEALPLHPGFARAWATVHHPMNAS